MKGDDGMKQFVDVKEVQETLGVSESKAYRIIKELNNQLKAAGYIVIAGRVNRAYFEERCCYGGKTA